MSDRHAAQPPLAGRYWPVLAVALLALAPNIVLTAAYPLMRAPLSEAVGLGGTLAQTAEALSNAGYAFGAVLAAWLVQRFRQRPLFLLTEVAFTTATVFAALAWAPGPYVAGRIVQGFATGLMLVVALPPLITTFGVDRLPTTAAAVNIGLFGAVTLGPVVGGLAASGARWRWLFLGLAALGATGVAIAAAALPHRPPFDPDRPASPHVFALAAAGTVLPFFGVAQLGAVGFAGPMFWAPVAAGLAALTALVVGQYRHPDPLVPVKALSTSLPVLGTLTAMLAGAGFVTVLELTVTSLLDAQGRGPVTVAVLFLPQVAGVALSAAAFGVLFRTRWLALLVAAGLALLVAAGVLLLDPTSPTRVLLGAAALGLGAGATVSPGLFLAAFGVPSSTVGRAFALVELLRSEAGYLVGPVLLALAMAAGSLPAGLHRSLLATIALLAAGTVALAGLALASRLRLQRPDLEEWLAGEQPALHSPVTGQAVRERLPDGAPAGLPR